MRRAGDGSRPPPRGGSRPADAAHVSIGVLLTSFASERTPATQHRTEQALLAGAALGEAHLHASALGGEVVGIGAFHHALDAPVHDGVLAWRRRTGGRAAACGDGFVLLTLALPHRSALVASERLALRPEQVMNRCVRGILAWLRGLGVDPVYPGLDTITAGRRWLAHLSFAETAPGPTLFQAVFALDGSFARTAHLLDRLDPEGRVPTRLIGDDETTCLARLAPHAFGADREVDLARLVADVASGYADTCGAEIAELDPAVTALLATQPDLPDAPGPPHAGGGPARSAAGLLGAVTVTARTAEGRVAELAVHGDMIAPETLAPALRAAIEGMSPVPAAVAAAVDRVVDGHDVYVLGLSPEALRGLVTDAVADAR